MSKSGLIQGGIHNFFMPVSKGDYEKVRRGALTEARAEHGKKVETVTFKKKPAFFGLVTETEAVNPDDLTSKDFQQADVVTKIVDKKGRSVGAVESSQALVRDASFAVAKKESSVPVKTPKLFSDFERSSLINMVQAIAPAREAANDALPDVSVLRGEGSLADDAFSFTGSATTVAELFDSAEGGDDIFAALRAVVPVEFKRAAASAGEGLEGVTGRGVATGQAAVIFDQAGAGERKSVRDARSLRSERTTSDVVKRLDAHHESTHSVSALDLAA